jgi:hypothetical protein
LLGVLAVVGQKTKPVLKVTFYCLVILWKAESKMREASVWLWPPNGVSSLGFLVHFTGVQHVLVVISELRMNRMNSKNDM